MNSFIKTVDIIMVKEKKKILAFSSDPQPSATSKVMVSKIFINYSYSGHSLHMMGLACISMKERTCERELP
jgi:hypothetical protein